MTELSTEQLKAATEAMDQYSVPVVRVSDLSTLAQILEDRALVLRSEVVPTSVNTSAAFALEEVAKALRRVDEG